MTFCKYEWYAPYYDRGDQEGRPGKRKLCFCELEEDHKGDHRAAGKMTAPNPKTVEVGR